MTDRSTGAGRHRRSCQVSGMDRVVGAVLLVVLASATGCSESDTLPPRADDSSAPTAAAASLDKVGIRLTRGATGPDDGAVLPRAAVAERGGLKPVDRGARADATDGRTGRSEAATMAPAGFREQRLLERRRPEDDRRKVFLLLLLGAQQSRRPEAP
jgi:hypothetical protein